jgi:cytochrome c peroxidase
MDSKPPFSMHKQQLYFAKPASTRIKPSKQMLRYFAFITIAVTLSACSSGTSGTDSEAEAAVMVPPADETTTDDTTADETTTDPTAEPSVLDAELLSIIDDLGLDQTIETSHLPDISEPLPQLGMKLFFSKSLGGDFDAACVSCHHPSLGGADQLSLPIGVHAVSEDLIGLGRENTNNLPVVPRNAPTIFNAGLWDTSLFWDSRVESIGKEPATNGAVSGIRTPDSDFNVADTNAGSNLASAQARFPVTSPEEMQGDTFESGSDDETVREHLAARIGGYGVGADELDLNNWLIEFQGAFGVTADAESLVTFDKIAEAIGEYERSMILIESPWQRYLAGDLEAISDDQKSGAVLFFTGVNQGGAGCAACHNGPLFSDGQHHTVAFPQAGPGKGDTDDDDFARERETGNPADRYNFRTPSLLNITETAPYGHAGTYLSLNDVVRHYINPVRAVDNFFDRGGLCSLPQYQTISNCTSLYPNNEANSQKALTKLQQERTNGVSRLQTPQLDNEQVDQLVAFLGALTDPCALDRDCIGKWIPDTSSNGPDGQQLNAVNRGNELL